MYAQLGTTIFDGYKSFVSFSQEEEAILVEHALIGRKPRLEGTGLGLRTLTLTLFLHQEFCQVEQEIESLRTSKDSFEILPLLWGNGKVEGRFVIKQLNTDKTFQDGLGNTYAASVDLVLKESVIDNEVDQLQLNAQRNAFAVGKNPATKSRRINPTRCDQLMTARVSNIRMFGGVVNTAINTNNRSGVLAVQQNCGAIVDSCAQIIVATETDGSCVSENIDLRNAANNCRAAASNLQADIYTTTFGPGETSAKDDNVILQSAIKKLCSVAAPIVQNAAVS